MPLGAEPRSQGTGLISSHDGPESNRVHNSTRMLLNDQGLRQVTEQLVSRPLRGMRLDGSIETERRRSFGAEISTRAKRPTPAVSGKVQFRFSEDQYKERGSICEMLKGRWVVSIGGGREQGRDDGTDLEGLSASVLGRGESGGGRNYLAWNTSRRR
jgi:hypothetical protein